MKMRQRRRRTKWTRRAPPGWPLKPYQREMMRFLLSADYRGIERRMLVVCPHQLGKTYSCTES